MVQRHNATVKTQKILLEAAEKVVNYLEMKLEEYEDNLYIMKPAIHLDPYNDGYAIRCSFKFNYDGEARNLSNKKKDKIVLLKEPIYIQPETFYESKMWEDQEANLKCKYYLKGEFQDYVINRISFISNLTNTAEFWASKIKEQIKY